MVQAPAASSTQSSRSGRSGSAPKTGVAAWDGRRRAAALLLALGPDISASILRLLPEDDVSRLTWEIVGIGKLNPTDRDDVLTNFYAAVLGRDFVTLGGVDYAQNMLERAFGKDRASELVGQLERTARQNPFSFLKNMDAREVVNFLQSQHPQVVALVLAYLGAERSALVMQSMPENVQAEIAVRLAIMERTTPDVIEEVEDAIRDRLGTAFATRQDLTLAGGIDSVVDLLRKVDLQTEKAILDGLESADPETANEIKKRMFVFENITLLDDRSIQRVLREVDGKDMSIALKGGTDEVRDRIMRNMSERAGKMLEDDMAALGPVRLRHVEEAQARIVAIIRRLEEAEEIFVMRGGEEDLLV